MTFHQRTRSGKYNNRLMSYEGEVFHSAKELERWKELKLLLAAKEITELERQPKFLLQVYGEKICDYIADFAYREKGRPVVEDVKGKKTPEYQLKKKLFLVLYKGVRFVEIKA